VANLGAGTMTVLAGTGGFIVGGSKAVTQGQVAVIRRRGTAGEFYCSVS